MSRRGSAEKVACLFCGHRISKVIDSRGDQRIRKCDACGKKTLTNERAVKLMPEKSQRATPTANR